MNNFLNLSENDRIILIKHTADKCNLTAEAVEKDFWVTLTLQILFALPYANKLVFKGGTSLSKAWKLITRFSEDIDVAIDRTVFGEEFAGDITKKRLKVLRKTSSIYVRDVLCADLNNKFDELGIRNLCEAVSQSDGEGDNTYPEPRQIHIQYKTLFNKPVPYLRTEVLIEISSRSLIEPTESKKIKGLISEQFPNIPDIYNHGITTALPAKTFLEKCFLLHEMFSTGGGVDANRKSRHLYDLERMMDHPFAMNAVLDNELWNAITHHRELFTPTKGVDYSTDIREQITLIPPADIIDNWRSDYSNMQLSMIYGNTLPFDELISRMEELQNRFKTSRMK